MAPNGIVEVRVGCVNVYTVCAVGSWNEVIVVGKKKDILRITVEVIRLLQRGQ
jgi:hypothetical protein